MTPLEARLLNEIEAGNPISVERYMALCTKQYYASRQAFGRGGDFITAPEISQMFGEIIGAWLANLWQRADAPPHVRLVELGPGRGTMIADILRAVRGTPDFNAAISVHLIETSPALRALQAARAPHAIWHDSLDSIPDDVPMMLVANEFLDALPVRQHVRVGDAWTERMLTARSGRLVFDPDTGPIRETAPARNECVARVAARIAARGGAALFIDYGYGGYQPAVDAASLQPEGDTLQAVKDHATIDPLAAPGESDITAHVDFASLARSAAGAGTIVAPVRSQGAFLCALGIEHRAAQLGIGLDGEAAHAVASALRRLIAPQAMGETFKVLAFRSPDWPPPAGL